MTTKEIREELRKFVPYERGRELRAILKIRAFREYVRRYTCVEQVGFIVRHPPTFREVGFQSQNNPYVYVMFTILTQHIYADSVEELLDKGIDMERSK